MALYDIIRRKECVLCGMLDPGLVAVHKMNRRGHERTNALYFCVPCVQKISNALKDLVKK
jgi:hypothetical protein